MDTCNLESDNRNINATHSNQIRKKSAKDFRFVEIIDEGSFSVVYLAEDAETKKLYAIKVCEKKLIRKENKTQAIMREKQVMNILNENKNPFFIQLFFTFQDKSRLFFGMNYAIGGELFNYIKKLKKFDNYTTIFYSAQILLALEHLHKLGILHRDLKPENIFLNQKFHIQISDFGSAYYGTPESIKPTFEFVRRDSFVGTAQYVTPEMLLNKKSSNGTDLWAFGCIIYQMLTGTPPFNHATEFLIFQDILKFDYKFPDNFNCDAKGLIESLLVPETKRLGVNDDFENVGYISIRSSKFFPTDVWSKVLTENGPLKKYINIDLLDQKLKSNQYDHIPVGLDGTQVSRLLGLELSQKSSIKQEIDANVEGHIRNEKINNHLYSNNTVILENRKLEKKKGFFSKLFKH